MNDRQVRTVLFLGIAGVIVASGVREMMHNREVHRLKRKRIVEEGAMDVAAIHEAADHVNARIDRGEIRSLGQLQDAITTEIAFQKMAIREDPAAD